MFVRFKCSAAAFSAALAPRRGGIGSFPGIACNPEGTLFELSCDLQGPDECRLECASAMQAKDLGAILIAGVSIRNVVMQDAEAEK